jgi:hypothetical protein
VLRAVVLIERLTLVAIAPGVTEVGVKVHAVAAGRPLHAKLITAKL